MTVFDFVRVFGSIASIIAERKNVHHRYASYSTRVSLVHTDMCTMCVHWPLHTTCVWLVYMYTNTCKQKQQTTLPEKRHALMLH